jgi:hypothetical protein
MAHNYWLDLFTGTTWDEFKKHGATVSGFRLRRRRLAKEIHPGDYLICYLTGIMRFVGVLEVESESYEDRTPIWDDSVFPVRFKVKLIHELAPATAVPVLSLRDKLSIFRNLKSPHAWTGFFRGSPAKFRATDGEIILQAIREAIANPIEREFDRTKYKRRPKIFESTKLGVVTVPEEEKEEAKVETPGTISAAEKSTHEEIQWLLLKLGSDLGLDVWVARNDRNRAYNGIAFADIPRLRVTLPRQFDEATNRTIELIDVLWLQGDAILAAFEVEHTSAIYSGLLRMADLITMLPNIKINLYLVAPEDRREKVFNEINRPTFAKLKPPLPRICKFISYSELKAKIQNIGSMIKYTRPEFIDEIAETCEPDEA